MTILTAQASGTPCILTHYEDCFDYIDAKNSYMIRVNRVIPVIEIDFFADLENLRVKAKHDLDHLAQLFRYSYEHPQEVLEAWLKARRSVKNGFSRTPIRHEIKIAVERSRLLRNLYIRCRNPNVLLEVGPTSPGKLDWSYLLCTFSLSIILKTAHRRLLP